MADRAQLSEAIDQAIRALQELKRVWEEQEEAPAEKAPAQAAAPSWQTSAPQAAAPAWQASAPQAAAPAWQASAPQAAAPAPAQRAVPEFRAQSGERTCPVCGSAVGSSSKFCKECGASLPAAAPAAPVFHASEAVQPSAPAANAAPARSSFCMKCGNRLQPGDRFCMKCGTPV